MDSQKDIDQRFLDTLTNLNDTGAAINRMTPQDVNEIPERLQFIVKSAIQVIPGSSAIIHTYNQITQQFDPSVCFSAGPLSITPDAKPRSNGLGQLAISQGQVALSYEKPGISMHPLLSEAGARTVAAFPLAAGGQTLGVLYVYLPEVRLFSRLELLLLENFVNQAAMALYQMQWLSYMQRSLARKEGEINRLQRAGLIISSRLRLDETLEAILEMALEITNARYGNFRLVDPGNQYLLTSAITAGSLAKPNVENLSIQDQSIMGWVALHRQPALISDLRLPPWNRIYYPLADGIEMRSELAVPLIGASGQLQGVLNLESTEPNAFSEEDSHSLQALATQAVVAIQEVRLLDALQEIAQLLPMQPCQQVLSRLVELTCNLLNARASCIWLLRESELEPLTLVGSPEDLQNPALIHTAQYVTKLLAPAMPGPVNPLVIATPLLAGPDRQPIGAFSVLLAEGQPARAAGSEWDSKVLNCLAEYAALAFQNAEHERAFGQMQKHQAIAETFAAIGDIAANLLHNLNNKVGSIPVRIQGIQDKSAAALKADSYLAKNLAEIERSATEAIHSVQETLSNLRPVRRSQVSIAECASEACRSIKLPNSIKIDLSGVDGLPLVHSGKHGLTLVFSNLFENAIEAMQNHGNIIVRGTVGPGWIEVTVKDTGPGIPLEIHDRIFELHYSDRAGDNERPASTAGRLGFGLWWVKTWMSRLGGNVQIESDGQHGASFRLRLPYQEE